MHHPTLDILLAQHDGKILIPLAPAAAAAGMATQTARNLLWAGRFPLPTVMVGGRRFIHVADLASYIDSLGSTDKPKRGARTKKERIDATQGQARGSK